MIVHDDEWCSGDENTWKIIDDYARSFFNEEPLYQEPTVDTQSQDPAMHIGDYLQQVLPNYC